MPQIIHTTVVHPVLFSAPVPVELRVSSNYSTAIDFTLNGTSYTFQVTRWSGQGFAGFLKHFHEQLRNEEQFGRYDLSSEGVPLTSKTLDQKLAIVLQGCADIINCVLKICQRQGRAILDYAVWYREHHREEDTYSEYITRLACHFIVHTSFLAPNVTWELVQF